MVKKNGGGMCSSPPFCFVVKQFYMIGADFAVQTGMANRVNSLTSCS